MYEAMTKALFMGPKDWKQLKCPSQETVTSIGQNTMWPLKGIEEIRRNEAMIYQVKKATFRII